MKPFILLGVAAVGLLVLTSGKGASKRSDEKVHGLPEAIKYSYLKPGETNTNILTIGPAIPLVDGQPLPSTSGNLSANDLNRYRTLAAQWQANWNIRKTTLPPDADRVNTDSYSKELYSIPAQLVMYKPEKLTPDMWRMGRVPIDEFGRLKPGHYNEQPGGLWNQTLGGLLRNPLFKTVVVAAVIASGPQGMAIYGAYTMWENRGKEFSLKNAALTAGRSYAVSQCGEGCGIAFDFGVGVASGKSYDKAAEDALKKEMTSEQIALYEQGKQKYKEIRS